MSNELPDAVIAGIMGWRGPGAYTAATLRKIREVIAADRAQNPGHLEASKTAETRMDTDFAGGLLSDRAQQGELVDSQAAFEAWTKSHSGFLLDRANDQQCVDGWFLFPTYKFQHTEIAWRAWANSRASIKAAAPADAPIREALNLFVKAAFPVCTSIDPRGYSWCTPYLDAARAAGIEALARATVAAQEQQQGGAAQAGEACAHCNRMPGERRDECEHCPAGAALAHPVEKGSA